MSLLCSQKGAPVFLDNPGLGLGTCHVLPLLVNYLSALLPKYRVELTRSHWNTRARSHESPFPALREPMAAAASGLLITCAGRFQE